MEDTSPTKCSAERRNFSSCRFAPNRFTCVIARRACRVKAARASAQVGRPLIAQEWTGGQAGLTGQTGLRVQAAPSNILVLPVVKIPGYFVWSTMGPSGQRLLRKPKLLGHRFPGNSFAVGLQRRISLAGSDGRRTVQFTGGEDQSYFGTRGLQGSLFGCFRFAESPQSGKLPARKRCSSRRAASCTVIGFVPR